MMDLSEIFQMAAIINLLPPVRKDFKCYIKHKRKKMSLKDLIIKLQVEEITKILTRKMSFPWLRGML